MSIFIALALLALAWLWFGRRAAGRSASAQRSIAAVSILLVMLAVIPRFYPPLLHTHLPLSITIWLEGVLPTFPWMMLAGAFLARPAASAFARFRRVGGWMTVLGWVYYLYSAVWMVLPNVDVPYELGRNAYGVWAQSHIDTCVPAACATALSLMDIPTSENAMADVVLAKPSRGSTLARAAYGLQRHLAPHDISVEYQDLNVAEVVSRASATQPVLITIKSNWAADHMVVVLGATGQAVLVANSSPGSHGGVPQLDVGQPFGVEAYRPEDFARIARPGAIVIRRGGG